MAIDDNNGMTLRDYFATHASEADVLYQSQAIREEMRLQNGLGILPEGWITKARYMHADAMLKERNRV